jgi:hypothetical protein
MGTTSFAALVGLLGILVPIRDPETYKILFKKPQKGDTALVTRQEQQNVTVTVAGANIPVPANKEKAHYVYQETILEITPGKRKPTRLRRQYQKAEVKADGQTRGLAYQGKTVLIEKKDAKYHFRIEGGQALTGADAQYLDREFNQSPETQIDFNQLVLPGKPVRIKESWAINVKALARDLEKLVYLEVDAAKSSGKGKLVRVYHKGGRRFGVMEMHLELTGKALKIGEIKLDLNAGSRMNLKLALDVCIDGSCDLGVVEVKMDCNMTATLPAGVGQNPMDKVTMIAQATHRESHQEAKK